MLSRVPGALDPSPPEAYLKFNGVTSESNACIIASCCAAAPIDFAFGVPETGAVVLTDCDGVVALVWAGRFGRGSGPLRKNR
jgi:hypothetical protein